MRCETATPPSPDPDAEAGDVCIVKDGASSTILQYDGSTWSAISGGSTSLGYYDPMAEPASANAASVEFTDGIAAMTAWDPATLSPTLTAATGQLRLTCPRRASNGWTGAYKGVPLAQSWSAWTRLSAIKSDIVNEYGMGLAIFGATPDATSAFQVCWFRANATQDMTEVYVQNYTKWDTFSSTPYSLTGQQYQRGAWIRVRWDVASPLVSWDVSRDGIGWQQLFSSGTTFIAAPTHIAIVGVRNGASGDALNIMSPFIRFTSGVSAITADALGKVI
jgi:hypothetical protein